MFFAKKISVRWVPVTITEENMWNVLKKTVFLFISFNTIDLGETLQGMILHKRRRDNNEYVEFSIPTRRRRLGLCQLSSSQDLQRTHFTYPEANTGNDNKRKRYRHLPPMLVIKIIKNADLNVIMLARLLIVSL